MTTAGGGAHVALLRAINVGGRNRIAMEDLRVLCTDIGLKGVRTYIQSGNVVFRSAASGADLETGIEDAIRERLGLRISVLVRSDADWATYRSANPFPEETEQEPKMVMLALSKKPPVAEAVQQLNERAADGERVIQTGDSIWVHFPRGSGRSRLSTSTVDRLVGSPVTTRNYLTVEKIGSLLDEVAGEGGPPGSPD